MFVHLKIHSLRVYFASKFDPIRVHKRGENTSHYTQRMRETGKSRKIIAKWSKTSATLIVNQLASWCTFGKRIMCFLVFIRFRCGNKGWGNGYGVFRSFLWFLDFYCEDCPFWKPPQFTRCVAVALRLWPRELRKRWKLQFWTIANRVFFSLLPVSANSSNPYRFCSIDCHILIRLLPVLLLCSGVVVSRSPVLPHCQNMSLTLKKSPVSGLKTQHDHFALAWPAPCQPPVLPFSSPAPPAVDSLSRR